MPRWTIAAAREHRNNPTASEAVLWKAIRHGQLDGLKFRRQHPIGGYFADFACPALRLIIEVDGPSHGWEEEAVRDVLRTEDLERQGWHVIRFTNGEVLGEMAGVLAKIRAEVAVIRGRD